MTLTWACCRHQVVCSALLVEPRDHPGLRFTLGNARAALGPGVPILWLHGASSGVATLGKSAGNQAAWDEWADFLASPNGTNVHLHRLPVDSFTSAGVYSDLLLQPSLWARLQVNGASLTVLCKQLRSFLKKC